MPNLEPIYKLKAESGAQRLLPESRGGPGMASHFSFPISLLGQEGFHDTQCSWSNARVLGRHGPPSCCPWRQGRNGQSLRNMRRAAGSAGSRGSTSNRGFEGFLNVEKGAGVSAGSSPGTGAGTNALTIHSSSTPLGCALPWEAPGRWDFPDSRFEQWQEGYAVSWPVPPRPRFESHFCQSL